MARPSSRAPTRSRTGFSSGGRSKVPHRSGFAALLAIAIASTEPSSTWMRRSLVEAAGMSAGRSGLGRSFVGAALVAARPQWRARSATRSTLSVPTWRASLPHESWNLGWLPPSWLASRNSRRDSNAPPVVGLRRVRHRDGPQAPHRLGVNVDSQRLAGVLGQSFRRARLVHQDGEVGRRLVIEARQARVPRAVSGSVEEHDAGRVVRGGGHARGEEDGGGDAGWGWVRSVQCAKERAWVQRQGWAAQRRWQRLMG